ncbi:ParA family protein [Desulfospira joergensenii]|uniref:ParA family protein n=1 Tax=Desulfospira joergensenii TaxID=53329 RepID=UPI0003B416D6|nr:ParA family protein [Desulfospira joergensenii]
MSNIFTISGQRGGIGKSITAVNLAASLALLEKKTLLIDCDPRAAATEWSGAGPYTHDIASLLSGKAGFMDTVTRTGLGYLDILPAGFELFFTGLRLAKLTSNEKILRIFIRTDVDPVYEYIIIDSPSSWGYLSVAALTAADWMISPVCPGIQSEWDFTCLLKLVNYVRKTHEVPLKLGGFLFNRCRTGEGPESFLKDQNLMEIKDLIFRTVIPEDPAVVKASDPLSLKNIKTPAASAYLEFAKEIVSTFN